MFTAEQEKFVRSNHFGRRMPLCQVKNLFKEKFSLEVTLESLKNLIKVKKTEILKPSNDEGQSGMLSRLISNFEEAFKNHKRKESLSNVNDYVVISDVHIPFHNENKFLDFLLKEESKSKNLIIAGDLFDGYNLSRYEKAFESSFEEEIYQTTAFLKICSESFNKVFILGGNHCKVRWDKFFTSRVPDDAKFLIKNPFHFAIENLNNVYLVWESKQPEYTTYLDHLVRFGNGTWISHGQFSKSGGKLAADKAREYIIKHIGEIPQMVAQGHTHQLYIHYEPHTIYLETGCLIDIKGPGMEYNRNHKGTPHLPVNGYGTFSLDEHDDLIKESVRVHPL